MSGQITNLINKELQKSRSQLTHAPKTPTETSVPKLPKQRESTASPLKSTKIFEPKIVENEESETIKRLKRSLNDAHIEIQKLKDDLNNQH